MRFTREFAEKINRTLELWRQMGLQPTRIELHVDTMREHFCGCWGVFPNGRVFVPAGDDIAYMGFQGLKVFLVYDRENESSYDTRLKENFSDRSDRWHTVKDSTLTSLDSTTT